MYLGRLHRVLSGYPACRTPAQQRSSRFTRHEGVHWISNKHCDSLANSDRPDRSPSTSYERWTLTRMITKIFSEPMSGVESGRRDGVRVCISFGPRYGEGEGDKRRV